MLSSRGISRSVNSAVSQKLTSSRLAVRSSYQTNTCQPSQLTQVSFQGRHATTPSTAARRFGTTSSRPSTLLSTNSALRTRRAAAAPITLAGAAATRNLSLWGWGWGGKKNTASAEDAAATTVETIKQAEEKVVETVTEAAATVKDGAADLASVTASELDLKAIDDIVNGQDVLNMPEGLGYLHALGLDYGWGPTSMMQWTLEHVHVWGGLGWGASIIATAFLLRIAMFYPQVRSLRFNAVMQRMKADPRFQEVMDQQRTALQNSDMEANQRSAFLRKVLQKEYGASPVGMLWAFMQIPFTFGLFRIIRGMSQVPVPALETSGYLWFTDLTVADPYFVLPAIGTGLMSVSLLLNMKHQPAAQQKMMKVMMYGFGAIGFVVTAYMSAGINLMTAAFSTSTCISAVILNNNAVRRSLGLAGHEPVDSAAAPSTPTYQAPRAAVAEAAADASSQGLRGRASGALKDLTSGLSEQISSVTGKHAATEEEKASKKRRELMKKLEQTRKTQEREEFDRKYKQ